MYLQVVLTKNNGIVREKKSDGFIIKYGLSHNITRNAKSGDSHERVVRKSRRGEESRDQLPFDLLRDPTLDFYKKSRSVRYFDR